MYFSTDVIYFVFYFIFLIFHFYFLLCDLGKFLVFSIYGVYNCQDCKQYVGAGLDTLMSISNGLGPSIFCRKMEKAPPMREKMDRKVVYFPPESDFLTLM